MEKCDLVINGAGPAGPHAPAPPTARVAADAAALNIVAGPVVPVLAGPGVVVAAVDAVDRAELREPAPGDDAAAK